MASLHLCAVNKSFLSVVADHVSILNSQRTNFLDLKPGRQQNVLQLVRPETPVERLACVGGMLGILQQMERHQAQPDVRTLTQVMQWGQWPLLLT